MISSHNPAQPGDDATIFSRSGVTPAATAAAPNSSCFPPPRRFRRAERLRIS